MVISMGAKPVRHKRFGGVKNDFNGCATNASAALKKMSRQSLFRALVLLTACLLKAAADECLGEFEVCPSLGTCVLDASLCGICKTAGEFLCPDGVTCVPDAEAVQFCPIVAPLFNWTLPVSERVAGTVAMLSLEEKAALIIMVSPVSAPGQGTPAFPRENSRASTAGRASPGHPRLQLLDRGAARRRRDCRHQHRPAARLVVPQHEHARGGVVAVRLHTRGSHGRDGGPRAAQLCGALRPPHGQPGVLEGLCGCVATLRWTIATARATRFSTRVAWGQPSSQSLSWTTTAPSTCSTLSPCLSPPPAGLAEPLCSRDERRARAAVGPRAGVVGRRGRAAGGAQLGRLRARHPGEGEGGWKGTTAVGQRAAVCFRPPPPSPELLCRRATTRRACSLRPRARTSPSTCVALLPATAAASVAAAKTRLVAPPCCLQDLETVRFWVDSTLPARDVSETYLPPFIGV